MQCLLDGRVKRQPTNISTAEWEKCKADQSIKGHWLKAASFDTAPRSIVFVNIEGRPNRIKGFLYRVKHLKG